MFTTKCRLKSKSHFNRTRPNHMVLYPPVADLQLQKADHTKSKSWCLTTLRYAGPAIVCNQTKTLLITVCF